MQGFSKIESMLWKVALCCSLKSCCDGRNLWACLSRWERLNVSCTSPGVESFLTCLRHEDVKKLAAVCNSQWHLPHLQSDVAGVKSCSFLARVFVKTKEVNSNHFEITCLTVPLSRCSRHPTWWKYWRSYLSARFRPHLNTKHDEIKFLSALFWQLVSALKAKLITSQHESIWLVHLRAEGGIRFCFCFSPPANVTESRCAGVIRCILFPESQLGNTRLGTIGKNCVSAVGAEGHCWR